MKGSNWWFLQRMDIVGIMQLTVAKLETTLFREIELVPLVFCIRRLSSSSQHRVVHIVSSHVELFECSHA
jgi:hypothetical protein